jgi:Flp pilus assembly protein TadG
VRQYQCVRRFSSAGRQRPRTQRGHQRGQSPVEFALILAVFLLIAFGVIDFGLGGTPRALMAVCV